MNMGRIDSLHSNKVKDMESQVLASTWRNFKQKKTLKFHLEFNFNNFQEKKRKESFRLILTIKIEIIRFHVNIIRELEFFIILHLY